MVTLAEAAEWGDALEHLTEREWAFVSAALADAGDFPLFLVLADWLDEHGRTAEGARIRRLVPKAGELLVGTTAPEDSEESAGDGSPPNPSPEQRLLTALAKAVRSACPDGGPSIVVLPHGALLYTLGEEAMRRLGWAHEGRVAEARAAERERCRAVLRERMDAVRRFVDEIAPADPHAAELAGAEFMALFGAINLLLSDQSATYFVDGGPDILPAGPEGATP